MNLVKVIVWSIIALIIFSTLCAVLNNFSGDFKEGSPSKETINNTKEAVQILDKGMDTAEKIDSISNSS